MSVLRKFKKGVTKSPLQFDTAMYNNVLGSLVITHYILGELYGPMCDASGTDEVYDVKKVKNTWRKLVKKGNLDFWLDDPDFISKALSLFGMKPRYGKFAACQSAFNVLFLPYIDDTVLPIREDGIFPMTAREGKIYPVCMKEEETNRDDK